jgi:hypothetical protein
MNAIPYEPAILAGCYVTCCIEKFGVRAHSFENREPKRKMCSDPEFENKKAASFAAGGFLSGSSAGRCRSD